MQPPAGEARKAMICSVCVRETYHFDTRQNQQFIFIHDPIANVRHIPRNNATSSTHRQHRQAANDTLAGNRLHENHDNANKDSTIP